MPRQNVETNISETLADGSCTTFLFLPNFDLLLLMVVMMMHMMVKKIVNKDDDNDVNDDDGDDADGDHTCDDDDDDDNVTLARPESQKIVPAWPERTSSFLLLILTILRSASILFLLSSSL